METRDKINNMPNPPKTIRLSLPFRMGSVNCYLLKTDSGFVLIDTGDAKSRPALLRELESAGCQPGALSLIAITHGDFDHTGNAAALRSSFTSLIAMHTGDLGMAEAGDMFAGRTRPNAIVRNLIPLFYSLPQNDRFTPDRLLEDGNDLSQYGLDAKVVSIPGHSKGSIGILTADGNFFCGDLLTNNEKPAINSLIDDLVAAEASFERLRKMQISTVYPGHGRPFTMDQLEKASENSKRSG